MPPSETGEMGSPMRDQSESRRWIRPGLGGTANEEAYRVNHVVPGLGWMRDLKK